MDTNDCPPSVYDMDSPARLVLDRIGDRWTILIVCVLHEGVRRFSELRTAVDGITPKVLTHTLRGLERDGLVTRTVHAEVPPRVEYELTDLGRDLFTPIELICCWAERHVDRFLEARAMYDARAA